MAAARALLVFSALSSLLALSCYSPSLNDVIYRCGGGGACPSGLSCIDGFCVVDTIPACKNGGIVPADAPFAACPGNQNGCGSGFVTCGADVSSSLCHNISDLDMGAGDLGAGDMGGGLAPAMCVLCCRASR
jgi:hypothetical protein